MTDGIPDDDNELEPGWRLHLSNRTLYHLDILNPVNGAGAESSSTLIGAWIRRDRVAYFDLYTGAAAGETSFVHPTTADRGSLDWQNFVNTLHAPNGATHTLYRMPRAVLRLTDDKKWRLYRGGAAELYLQNGGNGAEKKLEIREVKGFLAVRLDSASGVIAALDEAGKLHIYQGDAWQDAQPTPLSTGADALPDLVIANNGDRIFLTDRRSLIAMTRDGRVIRLVNNGDTIGRVACSPNGQYVISSDLDSGVLRVFDGATLRQTHQRYAVDLLAEAHQLQLIADAPPLTAALSALTISDEGIVAFAVAGVVCVGSIHQQFQKLPG